MDLLRSKCQCDKLQKQLKRYENKFSDLVSSYKTIIEEKKVLEETLKTLSSKSSSCSTSRKKVGESSSEDGSGETNDGSSQEAENTEEGSSSSSRSDGGSDESSIQLLEDKVAMLSKALNTVTEGKANMEAAFKNDRKSIIAEHAVMMEKVQEEKLNALKLEEETRSKLRQEQLEREDESKAHSLMLKELQEILAAERSEKDVLKLMLQEKDLSKTEKKSLEIGADTAKSETEMNSVTERMRDQTLEEEQEENERAEVDQQMELFRQNELNMEQMRATQFESMLADRQIQEEKRIHELESRISELSAVVGNYDRKRQEDLSVIKKLREKLEHLEFENSELSSQSPKKTEKYSYAPSVLNDSNEGNDSTHQACQEEYKQLLDEFDNYKRKNKFRITRDSSIEEVEEHKKRICRLEKEIDRLKVYHEEKERTNLKIIAGLQIDVTRSKEDYEERAENLSQECKLTVEQMECELRKQRERTMEVLADRDKEIERLQNKVYEFSGAPKESSSPCSEKQTDIGSSMKNEETSVVNEIFKKPTEAGPDALFYFHQQVTQYDAELYACRMQILDLESQVRDFEKREEQLLVQMQALKEEIRSLERNKSRESANLEYLKNVCLQYMLTDSLSVKSQMSSAISTILSFSPEEKSQLKKRQKGGWW